MTETSTTKLTVEALTGHSQMLRRLARSLLGDAHDAEDVVQEAALAALQKPPAKSGAVAAWLRVVTRRLALRQQRGARRRTHHERLAASSDQTPSAIALLERQQLLDHLSQAIGALGEDQRSVILLHYYDGLPLREIARRLDAPLATVRSRHQRAVVRLRESLDSSYGKRRRWQRALVGLVGLGRSSAIPTIKLVALGGLFIVLAGGAWGLWGGGSVTSTHDGPEPALGTTADRPRAPDVVATTEPVEEATREIAGERAEVDWLDVAIDARCRHVVSIEIPEGSAPEYFWLELFDTKRDVLALRRYVEPGADDAFTVDLDLLPGHYRMAAIASDGSRGERELAVNTTAEERGISIAVK